MQTAQGTQVRRGAQVAPALVAVAADSGGVIISMIHYVQAVIMLTQYSTSLRTAQYSSVAPSVPYTKAALHTTLSVLCTCP
jgi:hypothetical protein